MGQEKYTKSSARAVQKFNLGTKKKKLYMHTLLRVEFK